MSTLASRNDPSGHRRTVRPCDHWRSVLAEGVTDPVELCRLVDLPPPDGALQHGESDFPLLVPRPYVARIRSGDPRDPLLLQVLPQHRESEVVYGRLSHALAGGSARPRVSA